MPDLQQELYDRVAQVEGQHVVRGDTSRSTLLLWWRPRLGNDGGVDVLHHVRVQCVQGVVLQNLHIPPLLGQHCTLP